MNTQSREFNVVALLLELEEIKKSTKMNSKNFFETTCIYAPFGNEKDSFKLKLTFNREVLDSKMVFPFISQALIEGTILFWRMSDGLGTQVYPLQQTQFSTMIERGVDSIE